MTAPLRVFVTGATGYIGTRVVAALARDGHRVAGLARSDAAGRRLHASGVAVHRGDLRAPETVLPALDESDAVVHIPLAHDFGGDAESDAVVTARMLSQLAGTGKAFVYTSGTRVYGDTAGRERSEVDVPDAPRGLRTRVAIERRVLASADEGVRAIVVRPGLAYGHGESGVLSALVDRLHTSGSVPYIGLGDNVWATVHVDDLADLYAIVVSAAEPGLLVNAVAPPPPSVKEIADALVAVAARDASTQSLGRDQAVAELGPLGEFLADDMRVEGRAVAQLGWRPTRPSLLSEIVEGSYRPLLDGG